MKNPQCDHGSTEWAILVDGDPAFGSLLTSAAGRGCRCCATQVAEFWFRQSFVNSVAVVPTADLEAVRS